MFKPTHLHTPEHILERCTHLQRTLAEEYSPDLPLDCVDRLVKAEAGMIETAKLLADAKHHLRQLQESTVINAITKSLGQKLPATALNKYLDAATRDSAYLVDWCERLNRACTHAADFQRTLISKHREEARLAGMGHAG